MLDFKATDESTKVELPLFIEVKGKRVESGVGSLTVSTHSGKTPCSGA